MLHRMPKKYNPRVVISKCPEVEPHQISWIKIPPYSCEVNRQTYCYSTNKLTGNVITWTHNGCVCNQIVALRYRHQVASPIPDIDFMQSRHNSSLNPYNVFRKYLCTLKPVLTPWKRHKVVNSYEGKWRAKYFKAQETYHFTGFLKRYSSVNMFVKNDLEMTVPEKAPRAIQFRHPVFALEQGRFTKPMEEWMYAQLDEFGTKIFAKSDPFTVAASLYQKASNFQNPVFLMLDASKFDSCVDKAWIKISMACYLSLFPRRYRRNILHIWRQTLVNRGRTRKGLRYLTHGTRMSGDMDTSLGNCLIMFLMLKIYLLSHKVKHSLMINGDDSLIVIERRDLEKCRDIQIFKKFGFNMKFEVAMTIEEAEFCQARLINTDYGVTMSRNPHRILGRTAWTTDKYNPRRIRAFINTLGLCERASSYGVPIASIMATKMIEFANTNKKIELPPWLAQWYKDQRKPWKTGPPKISNETRASYESAWGITIAEQLRIEDSIVINANSRPTPEQKQHYHNLVDLTWGDYNPNAWPNYV